MRRSVPFIAALVLLVASAPAWARPIRPGDISMPDGFNIEMVVDGLDAPTMAAFDDQNRMLIAESGYLGGGDSRVTRVERDGTKTVLADGDDFGAEQPVTAVAFHDGNVYAVHAGTVSIIEPGGRLRSVITGLPGQGDHQANQLVFDDGFMYLSMGTVTNSAVVGPDNQLFGWLGLPERRQLHDVPCQDVTVTDQTFESHNVFDEGPGRVRTSPYAAFGTTLPAGTTVKGDVRCNGAVLRARPDGSNLEMVAWGLRNPYGLEMGPDGALYVTDHGFDSRGSRPVENAPDCFYRIDQGQWYGWPDFACGEPVTDDRFRPHDEPQPGFVITNHPTQSPAAALARFDPHAATNGFAFSPNRFWGSPETAYVALFGDMTPGTGTVSRPKGVEVVKVNTRTGQVSDFISNKVPGRSSQHSTGGLEHPSDVTFGPDDAMYITDWSVARPSDEGLKVDPESGVVWKVTLGGGGGGLPGGPSLLLALLATVILAGGTVLAGAGAERSRRVSQGALAGAVAGLAMGGFTMIVAPLFLDLPWYSPPRVLATMVMGRSALAKILQFDLLPFLLGVVVLVVLTVALGALFGALIRAQSRPRIVLAGLLFGLAGWALLQYFVLPVLFPLVTDKGFPPRWYAASFAVYGLVLGAVLAALPAREPRETALAPRS
ncbi:MAG: PQQ-dependent sugar dehydrogenase [Actinomycetota bacterium]|nr:PQQ-dependent sugar dehydrogenase [Actinomycetota bacterium]